MIYKISYKSRDLRRKNVLVYGIEELPLFEVNINISGYACETEERARQIEEYSNEEYLNTLSQEGKEHANEILNEIKEENFKAGYQIFLYTNVNHENLIAYLNEKQIIDNNNKKKYREVLHTFETIDEYFASKIDNNRVLTYEILCEELENYKSIIEDFINESCSTFEWECTEAEEWTFKTQQELISEQIELMQLQRAEAEIISEQEDVVNSDNEQPIEEPNI
jgi:hypothetical protein